HPAKSGVMIVQIEIERLGLGEIDPRLLGLLAGVLLLRALLERARELVHLVEVEPARLFPQQLCQLERALGARLACRLAVEEAAASAAAASAVIAAGARRTTVLRAEGSRIDGTARSETSARSGRSGRGLMCVIASLRIRRPSIRLATARTPRRRRSCWHSTS